MNTSDLNTENAMGDHPDRLGVLAARQGWSDETLGRLALDWLCEAGHGDAFVTHLEAVAAEENADDAEGETEAYEVCYYKDPGHCDGEVWTCSTCLEHYCAAHSHATALGRNVECVACEGTRLGRL